jgi:hypothetical protein
MRWKQSDIELDRQIDPATKLHPRALELMATGLRMQRANIRRLNPDLDEASLQRAF